MDGVIVEADRLQRGQAAQFFHFGPFRDRVLAELNFRVVLLSVLPICIYREVRQLLQVVQVVEVRNGVAGSVDLLQLRLEPDERWLFVSRTFLSTRGLRTPLCHKVGNKDKSPVSA